MKKALLILCLFIGLSLFAAALIPMRHSAADALPVLSDAALSALTEGRRELPFDLLSFHAAGSSLPCDTETNTWYTPVLSDAVTAAAPPTFRIARGETADDGSCRVLLYNRLFYAEYTLTETGLPVIDIQLRRFDLDPKYIGTERIAANLVLLSAKEDGTLLRETGRIEIRTRSGSSINYEKKSYTLFLGSRSDADSHASPLGLTRDYKFALNSLYEDDSKIRDVFAYRLWEQLEPHNALKITYAELLINDAYYGLYGMHNLPTENSLSCGADDTVYKINSDLELAPEDHRGDDLPSYEIAAGDPLTAPDLSAFLAPFSAPIETFPTVYDRENLVNFSVLTEVLACEDTSLKNLLVTYDADAGQYRLTGWDMDQSLGCVWDAASPLLVTTDFSLTEWRYLEPSDNLLTPLGILYESCPDFREEIAARYRELRKTVFTDEALLEEAAMLYDFVTDCGARARDAARWEDSAISADNSFIEAFIPARTAFLDGEFGA